MDSLHAQGILEPGKPVVVEGVAAGGTIDAIRIAAAQRNPANRALFRSFGEALSARRRAA